MELILLAIFALLVFGPRKLPEVARAVARIMAELRRASNEFRYSLEDEIRHLDIKEAAEQRAALPPPPPPPPGTMPRASDPLPATPPPDPDPATKLLP